MQSGASGILSETIDLIRDILGADLDAIAIERVVVGLFFTGVKLDNGYAGTCATPLDTIPTAICCPRTEGAVSFPAPLRGRRAAEVMTEALGPAGIRRAVGIATVNALADCCWTRRPHPACRLDLGADAFDATSIRPDDKVVVVGAFVPFLKQLKRRGQSFLVLERDPSSLKADELAFYRPADAAPEVVPQADVVLITGSTLVGGTLEDLLALARPTARVTIVGPTVGLLPDPLLERGADILGAIRIVEPDGFLDLLAEGGSAARIDGRSAEKIVLSRCDSVVSGRRYGNSPSHMITA